MTLKEQEKERATPPPARAKPFRAADTQLFADQHRRDFASEVAYRLGDVPELAPWRAWYPALVAEFWLARGFVVRVNDPQTVVDVWGRELAKIGATEAEVAAAFEWARVDAVNHRGDAVYSRPDLLREVRRRILAKRPRLTNQAVHRAPVDRPHESTAAELAAWDRAGEAEREAVRERVGRRVRYRGPMFERDCARELARELARRAAAAPSTGVT